jgi:hypothetical protein
MVGELRVRAPGFPLDLKMLRVSTGGIGMEKASAILGSRPARDLLLAIQ